jgi:chaperone BCS1
MFEEIITFIKEHEWLMAGLGISGFGLISFWIKDVPLRFFSFLKRQFTTDLIITNYDEIFYELLKHIQKYNETRKFRTFKLNNGKWGTDNNVDLTMGYGTHFIWYKRWFLFLDYVRDEKGIADRVKETITLTKLGRSRKMFDNLVLELQDARKKKKDKISFNKMGDEYWHFVRDLKKRPFESLFIEQEKKNLILNTLEEFLRKEEWYIKSGIPYQLGFLLYGSPGTGKTTLIKCLASYLNYSIFYLSPSKLSKIETAFSTIKEKSILVIEDIDTNTITSTRKKKSKKIKKDDEDIIEAFSFVNLSDVLNSLDGLANVHGRILIGTTNHLDKLDTALIRPGRFDLLVELGYVNKKILKQFFAYHYPEEKINYQNLKIKPNLSMAELQQMLLQNYTTKQILEEINL